LRAIERYAVRVGGAYNHRNTLEDGVLIKDNHIEAGAQREVDLAGVIALARSRSAHTVRIAVEVTDAAMAREAIAAGADVIMLEPADGHPLRRLAPFTEAGESVPAMNFLANKRAVTLDLDDPAARARALDLVRRADVLISSHPPSRLAEWGMTYAAIAQPSLVMAHVTPHDMTGARAEAPGNDLTAAARSGWASINGTADREPLKPSGWASSYCAGIAAYAATVAAVRWATVVITSQLVQNSKNVMAGSSRMRVLNFMVFSGSWHPPAAGRIGACGGRTDHGSLKTGLTDPSTAAAST